MYMPDGKTIPLDLAFVRWMTIEHGIVMIPVSFFYLSGSKYTCDRYVRLSIGKFTTTMEKAIESLIERFG